MAATGFSSSSLRFDCAEIIPLKIGRLRTCGDLPTFVIPVANVSVVTFAKTGAPNSRTTQTFINFGDNSRLDGMGFAAFGKIDEAGMKIVDKLYAGYGEGAPSGSGPDQGRVQSDGNAYLLKNFPKLDYIKKAVVLE